MRVLQVEDDPAAARAVEQMMKSKGYACQTTAYGEEAVELATDNGYDLILLDIMLPDIDGYEVLRRLQAAGVATPVLIQSGVIGRDEMKKAGGSGFEDYLAKPFTRKQLDERIGTVMARVDQMAAATATAAPGDPGCDDRRGDSRDDGDARRSHPRVRTLKGGQIVYNNANCVADCLILNMSDGGAALQATDAIDLPNRVTLKEKQGKSYNCEICWQHGKKLGVRFI
jgi:DNA-binding response OmpR family regulator